MSEKIEKPNCYVASPYGFAESTKDWYYETFLPLLRNHVTVLDPWSVNVEDILQTSLDERRDLWTKLGERHYNTIAKEAKLVVAGLDQEPPDNGTACEVVWAAAHNIPVIGYRGDMRTSGEDGMPYNLMIAAAIKLSGGVAVTSLTELEKALKRYVKRLS